MKALQNILTRWMLMLLLLATSCTNDVADVETPMQPGQYVTVHMQVPGMTTTASRAADGVITSITALAFDTNDAFLGVVNATNIGSHTFNLSVPDGTSIIHFLANLPDGIRSQLPGKGGTQVEVLKGLTTTDTENLIYWGVAEYISGNLYVDLYRNMAMITIAPSDVDTDFNQFSQDSLFIAGLYNTNTVGAIVPYKEGFTFNMTGYDYFTLPASPTPENKKYTEPYSASTYVFEHANTRQNPLCAICKIGNYFYKVALVDDRNGEPYDIIRNHKYIIYVSDVDDYQSDTYQAESYDKALEKEPINLDVDKVQMVTFTCDNSGPLDLNEGERISVKVGVPEVKDGSLTAIYIEADDFGVTAESGLGLTGPVDGVYTYIPSMNSDSTLTFTPTSAGAKNIVFTGEAMNMEVPRTEISVAVYATITATADKTQLYCDSETPQTITVDVTIPKGVTDLNISAADFTYGEETGGTYTYTRTDDTTQATTVQFVFTLKSGLSARTSTITFSDGSGNDYVEDGTVEVTLEAMPVVGEELVLFESVDGERCHYNTRKEICNANYVNNNLDYFVAENLLCIDLYYHSTQSTLSVIDAWGGSDKISGVSYSFDDVGYKNIQIILSDEDVAILKLKGMCILPSADEGGFTLYKVSIKKVQSN